jgi:hypothetical protein
LYGELLLKTTQFLQGNNVLDTLASNTLGFLLRDACVSSPWVNRPIWNKMSLFPIGKHELQEVFLSKPNSNITEKEVLDARVLTHIGSFEELYVFHQFSCK